MKFHEVTLATGTTHVQDTTALVPEAVAVFARLLAGHGDAFQVPIPVAGLRHLALRWTVEVTVALATFSSRQQPLTTSILLPGLHRAAETDALADLVHSFSYLHDLGERLARVQRRPLVATIVHLNLQATEQDVLIVSDMETCLAAAWFEQLKMRRELA